MPGLTEVAPRICSVRRFFSILFFVLGGWMLMGQMLAAFLDIEPGPIDNFVMVAIFAILVLPLLLIGFWVSPGERRRELGLTILISVGFALFTGLSFLLVLVDPTMSAAMPPMPEINYAPIVGAVNLLVLIGAGLWLYRRKPKA